MPVMDINLIVVLDYTKNLHQNQVVLHRPSVFVSNVSPLVSKLSSVHLFADIPPPERFDD